MYSNDEIDRMVYETIKNNKIKKVNNLFLSNKQISILDMYNIDYKNKNSISELIFEIESYINDSFDDDLSELENLSLELSEFNYYYNTNK